MTLASRTQRRILRDLKKITDDKAHSNLYAVKVDSQKLNHWDITLFGTPDSLWSGGTFKMTVDFPDDYPHAAPDVRFVDIPFHPNVYQNGKICIDILQANWSSSYDIAAVMTAITVLMADPNPNSPANNEAAVLYTSNMNEYRRRVQKSFPQNVI